MREILFKAKRICSGEWVEGFVVRPFSRNAEGNITNYCFNALDEMGFVSECIVSADTICQYTGLTDKNGNKIWENDVVGYYSEYSESWNYGTVSYGEFNCSCCDGVYGWTFGMEDIRDYKSYEVKGNIFDNPELIGG